MHRAIALLVVFACFAGVARGQFSSISITDSGYAMFVGGDIVRGENAPPIEEGDQIGAFYQDQLVGFVELSASRASSSSYSQLKVFGDNPNTVDVKEGPALGDIVTFRYFDASTNTTITSVQALNEGGEAINFDWQGDVDIDVPGLPLPVPLIPTEVVGLRIGAGTTGGGGGDGDGDGTGGGGTTGDPDVNNDGKVDREDAAMVLRIALGGGRLVDENTAARADVNGDGSVTTADAIAVLRAR